jgi:hypothetical protein
MGQTHMSSYTSPTSTMHHHHTAQRDTNLDTDTPPTSSNLTSNTSPTRSNTSQAQAQTNHTLQTSPSIPYQTLAPASTAPLHPSPLPLYPSHPCQIDKMIHYNTKPRPRHAFKHGEPNATTQSKKKKPGQKSTPNASVFGSPERIKKIPFSFQPTLR